MKYAIYSTSYGGLYYRRYIDNLKDCTDLIGGWLIKEEDLPIVVNNVGGRCPFCPTESNFVKIVECDEGKKPLTREEMYPKNSDKFEYGWIDCDGNTYTCGHECHYRSAEYICEELGYKCYNSERELEKRGWLKVTALWLGGKKEKQVFSDNFFVTKRQADTLFDLGLYELNDNVKALVYFSEKKW